MKKIMLFFAAITITAATLNAQTTFSIAGNVGIVTDTYGKLAAGGDLQVDLPATTGLKITLSGGYQNFSYKTNAGVKFHSSFIPVMAGAKFDLSKSLYGHAQLGYSFSTVSGGSGAFTYAPSIGYMLGNNLDLALKYLGISANGATSSAVVARLAYTLGK
jgi:hypothetical protein